MNSCHSCGGVIGRDCWNPQECAEITERMAIEQSQPDPAPSNANTSGLEVVAWLTTGGDVTRSEAYAKEQSVNDPDNYPSALVTAASAQARIAELDKEVERWISAYNAAHDQATENGGRANAARDRATAAEARADRAEARIAEIATMFGVCDGGRYLNDWKARLAALQQEKQP